MCELYNERGIERIGVLDVGTGAWNFLLTAVGGTLIGVESKSPLDFAFENVVQMEHPHIVYRNLVFYRCCMGFYDWYGDSFYGKCESN